MGSTSTHKEAGVTVREFFENYFSSASIVVSHSNRAPVTSDWQYEFYAAVRYDEGHPRAGEVFGMVVLYSVAPSSYYNFSYKEMDETEGPWASHASRRVLEALTPTDSEYAQGWRDRCWANLELAAAKPRVRPGDRVRFDEGFTFSSALQTTADTVFEVVERDVLRLENGQRVKIPRWRSRSYSLVGA